MKHLRQRRPRATVFLVVTLVVAPLVLAATWMSAMWDPTPYLRNVQLAVVNEDEGATQNGEELQYGASVAESLVETDYLNFTLTDAATAAAGLENGDYMFVLSIPADFTQDILTLLSDEPVQPEVVMSYNDYYGSNSPVLTKALVPQIQQKISAGISERYATRLLSGIDSLGSGLADAAAGAAQLDDGMGQLEDGLQQGYDGAVQLEDGAAQLAAGTTTLNSGANQLSTGATELASGMDTLAAGTTRLGDGATQIDAGVRQLTQTLIPILEQAGNLTQVLSPIADGLEVVGDTQTASQLREIIASFDSSNPQSTVNKLRTLEEGTAQLAYNLSDPTSTYLSGVLRLQAGAHQLATGAGSLAAGSAQLNDGAQQLADGTTRLRSGTEQLSAGASQLAAGTTQLRGGLSSGAAQAPSVGNLEGASHQVAIPVAYETDYYNAVQTQSSEDDPTQKDLSSGAALLFLLVFGYLIMAIVSMLAPHILGRRRYTKASSQVLSGFAIVGGVDLALITVLALLGKAVGWEYQSGIMIALVLVVIAGSSTAIYQMLRICFRRVLGGILALGFFAYGLFSFGGVWPIKTIPAPIRLFHDIHPMSYARTAFIDGSAGNYDASFWAAMAVLILSMVLSLVISIVVRRNRLQLPQANKQQLATLAA